MDMTQAQFGLALAMTVTLTLRGPVLGNHSLFSLAQEWTHTVLTQIQPAVRSSTSSLSPS